MLSLEELASMENVKEEYKKAFLLNLFQKICVRTNRDPVLRMNVQTLFRQTHNECETICAIIKRELNYEISKEEAETMQPWFIAHLKKSKTRKPKLNNNNPLRGRIIMGAEKIRGGIKAKEVMSVLRKAKIQDLAVGDRVLNDEEKVKVICLYLSAWERVVGFSFANSSGKEAGAAVKIAGLRYMLLILPTIWERAVSMRRHFDADFVEETLKAMISSFNVVRESFFVDDEIKKSFSSETMTETFATTSSNIIRALGAGGFDPLSGI